MIIIEAILTYFVWTDGYGWDSLIPLGFALISGAFVNAGIMASGGDVKEMIKNRDPKLGTVAFIIDLIIVFILIIMLVAN